MELCAVVPLDQRTAGLVDVEAMFRSSVPTSLHFAVLVRLSVNYGSSGKLTSELAEEFVELGWCTYQEYMHVTRDLIDRGLTEGVELQVNPLFHTGDGCIRCADHKQAYEQDLRDHQKALERWQARAAAYPYDTSKATLHLRDCTYARKPETPESTLGEYVHSGDFPGGD